MSRRSRRRNAGRKHQPAKAGDDHLALIVRAAGIGTWDLDPVEGTMEANASWFEMLGEEPIAGRFDREWFWDRIHDDDRMDFYSAFLEARNSEDGRFDCQLRLRSADGSYRWIMSHGNVIARDDSDEITRIVGVNIDVHERGSVMRELEEARAAADEASAAKSDFLARMSHELRTPLTAILGYAEIVKSGLEPVGDESARDESAGGPDRIDPSDASNGILEQGRHLLDIIGDILDLTQLESGTLSVDRQPIGLRSLMSDIRRVHSRAAAESGIDLRFDVDADVPDQISTDANRLRQALNHLVENAVKFTEDGHVAIRVAHRPGEGSRSSVIFDIEDTGIGIEPEHIGHIFSAFSRADESMNRQHGGTGLGLSIARSVAIALGGGIEIESTPGEGSRFSFSIEVDSQPATRLIPVDISGLVPDPSRPLGGYEILLVEDGPDNRRLLGFHLRKAGATVTMTEDGLEGSDAALERWRTDQPFDAILMDMQMPVMDGYTATRRLRDEGYAGPIIAVTAHALPEDRTRCLEAGCDEFSTKPVDRDLLFRMIVGLIECRDGVAPPSAGAGDAPLRRAA